MLVIHNDWGTIHFICFAENGLNSIKEELRREGNPLKLIDPKTPRTEFHDTIYTVAQLKNLLIQLDTSSVKTFHFLSHGKEASPGYLFFNEDIFVTTDFNLTHKNSTILSFVSVCYQQELNISGYKHLFTSGNFAPKLGVTSINHALEHLYTKPFNEIDIVKFQKHESYWFKY